MASFHDDRSPSPVPRRPPGPLRRVERCCAVTLKHFPLALVYGLTTWAVLTEIHICLAWQLPGIISNSLLLLGLILYGLLNWSYTVAVFTDPGTPANPPKSNRRSRFQYSHLPTSEPDVEVASLTVKSTGDTRFCKKCQFRKPDRAHHCSTCGRCVLKMDHHCPWLATCVGFRNYKAFLLFCGYVTIFCWVCCGVATFFVTTSMLQTDMAQLGDFFAVNAVLLTILGGIFGLVMTGFTGWHIHLSLHNQTTIEALEKTRYLRPIRRTMDQAARAFPRGGENDGVIQRYGHQLAEMHANAIPGVTRPEEGEIELGSGTETGDWGVHANDTATGGLSSNESEERQPLAATASLHQSYAQMEQQQERARYEAYLDEQESAAMPHAFDLGWRRNLLELFGEKPWLWPLPIESGRGDGWAWEPSLRWVVAQEERQKRREERERTERAERRDMPEGLRGLDEVDGSTSTGIPYGGPPEEFQGVHAALPRMDGRRIDADTRSTDGIFNVGDGGSRRQSAEEGESWADWD